MRMNAVVPRNRVKLGLKCRQLLARCTRWRWTRPLRSSRWLRPTRRFRRSSATPSGRRSWRRRGERWKPPRTSALTRACRQPAPGAVVPGLGNGMMLRGDVAEWVAEKDRELQRAQTQLQESTLLWAKVAAWVGVAGTVVAIIIAVLGR